MFTGLSMICLIPFLVSTEQDHARPSGMRLDNNRVVIHLNGDVAREYLRILRSPRLSDAFLKNGRVTIEGSADNIGDGTVRIRHVAFVRIVGEPVRLLRLESTIDANAITQQQTIDAGIVGTNASCQLDLSEMHFADLRSSVMVGDFPNPPSYR